MLRMNASPTTAGSSLIPSLRYHDAPAAIDWLCRAFGFSRHLVIENPDGTIAHAQLTLGPGMVMLGSVKTEDPLAHLAAHPGDLGGRQTGGLYLYVERCEETYASVQASGATIVGELHEPDYGGQAFACLDPEGYLWSVGSYDPWAPHEHP